MIRVALKTCITKLHFRIGPMTMLVLHQAVPPHFTTKLRPWSLAHLGTMQSLQNQFVKAVAVHGVHIIAPYSCLRRKFSWGFHSVAYGGHFHLVCALCDVTI